jgi:hypothetical protein
MDGQYDQAKSVSVNYNYGGNEKDDDDKMVLKTPELYQNPNSAMKSLTLPAEILEYNSDKFPDNGAADTFAGASLKTDLSKKCMMR